MASRSGNESGNTEGLSWLFLMKKHAYLTTFAPLWSELPPGADTHTGSESGSRSRWEQWDRAQLQYGQPEAACIIYLLGTQPGVSVLLTVDNPLVRQYRKG